MLGRVRVDINLGGGNNTVMLGRVRVDINLGGG